jgi:type IV pilus assembly protein PilB|tara:strand:+ start:22 stop:1656 length:1635 start_codon:yes stop_codon:yes gene_type:complete
MNQTLGQVLVSEKYLTPDQINEVLKYKDENRARFGDACIKLGFIDEDQLMDVLGQQLHLPRVDLENFEVDSNALDMVDKELAKNYNIVPLYAFEDEITVATAEPLNVNALDAVNRITGLKVQPALATITQISHCVEDYSAFFKHKESFSDDEEPQLGAAEEEHIVAIADQIMNDSMELGTSDIHIEHLEKQVVVRVRVDGIMQELIKVSKANAMALVSRFKVMSGIDIAESRKPQDGRFEFKSNDGKKIDLRVSTYPSAYGEKIVMRILDPSKGNIPLEKLGFSRSTFKKWSKACNETTGIVLVTGPTGSGKSTTLYATLTMIADIEKHVITIEDPIEYKFDGIVQGQLNERAGMTFASALRAMLRQDPDIIMVGEMRDRETIDLAVRAALTGHLVLSTLHTNDAAATYSRLFDMGSDPFLLSTTVRAILAQRLIRCLCEKCKEPYDASEGELESVGMDNPEKVIYKPHQRGCTSCSGRGYKGRAGLYELLVPSPEINEMVKDSKSDVDIRKMAYDQGMSSLQNEGFQCVKNGVTSIEEVKRVL